MKVAIVHYWLVNMRGGEKVLEALLSIYPDADIYTHVAEPEKLSTLLASRIKATTFIAKMPLAKKHYQKYLPLMPLAIEQLDLTSYDLVISSESGPAKGVIVAPEATHICYCHSPMRYIWDMQHEYIGGASLIKKLIMAPLLHYMRIWDVTTSARVSYFIANSHFVKARIWQYYRRDAKVIYPPVDSSDFDLVEKQEDYYLLVGQLVAYKRADLAINAFKENGKKLVVIGGGEQFKKLSQNLPSNITLLGKQPFEVLKEHYQHCKALIFPGVEDFGIVPLEAMACGRPVIAYAKGGALETVKDNMTGIYFQQQSVEALNKAIDKFENSSVEFNPKAIREHALQFRQSRFIQEVANYIDQCLAENVPL